MVEAAESHEADTSLPMACCAWANPSETKPQHGKKARERVRRHLEAGCHTTHAHPGAAGGGRGGRDTSHNSPLTVPHFTARVSP